MKSNPNPNYRLPMGITLNCALRCDPTFAINFKEIQENLRKVMKMFQPKFKIGDQVRVKKDLKVHERRGGYQVTPQIYYMRGNTAIVTSIGECRSIPFVQLDNKFLYFSPEMLERVKPEKIVIYQNGNKVVAKNTANGKTAEARCNPSDDFDFNIGAKLAFERLVNSEPEKPKYYSGKVVCIDARTDEFTKGRIYEVKNGRMKTDLPSIVESQAFSPYSSFADLTNKLSSQFIELVE